MKSAKFHINAMSLYRNTVKNRNTDKKSSKNDCIEIWPLNFDLWPSLPEILETLVLTLDYIPTKFEKDRFSPLGGVGVTNFLFFPLFFHLKIHTSPSITWPLMPVAMVTIYFGSSSHPHDTCKVSCQCDVPLQKYCKNMIFTKFDLWPLTFDLYFR